MPVCVCYQFIYPAACGPKGHGSSGIAVLHDHNPVPDRHLRPCGDPLPPHSCRAAAENSNKEKRQKKRQRKSKFTKGGGADQPSSPSLSSPSPFSPSSSSGGRLRDTKHPTLVLLKKCSSASVALPF